MATSSSTKQLDTASSKSTKKKSFFFSFPKKKSSKQKAGKQNPGPKPLSPNREKKSGELMDRAKFDSVDYSTSRSDSVEQNLIAMAYKSTTTESFRASPNAPIKTPATTSRANKDTDSGKSGSFSFLNFTGTSFFRKMCNDVFDSIDVDQSGEIDESELYQGLLLIHLKLGLYFGPAACKPISLDRTKFIFNKLDTNRDGTLDKGEFQSVLALLMGNVVSRIIFQFVCTLLIVPFVAHTILEKSLDGYVYVHGIATELFLPVFLEYQPLLEVALGWDLITRFASTFFAIATDAIRNSWIVVRLFDSMEGQVQFVAEKYYAFAAFVLETIAVVPQETWDSLPLTFLSTVLTLIMVPYSIVKTDDFFRFLANRFGIKGGSAISLPRN